MCEISQGSYAPENAGETLEIVDWLLTNPWIVTCDSVMTTFPQGALAIRGDTLAAIGPAAEITARFRGIREMDLRGHLVLPGLINTHTHAAMTCFRGLADDLPLSEWLHHVIFPAEAAHVNADLVYWGTLLAIAEMLQNGITTFCDGYFFEEYAARAALDAGIRGVLGQGILDYPCPDQPHPKRARERAAAFLDAFPRDTCLLRPSLFCHAPYTCSPETLQWVKELCRQKTILFQTHLSETAAEVAELSHKYGERPVQFLDRLGILDANTLCAHGVWLDAGEIELLAQRQVGLSHTAESNMKLGAGVAPLPELLAARVKVGLGTDGCASNNNLDLFAEMDMVAKLHKVFRQDPQVCSAREVLAMATLGGARALAWDSEIGSLEAGKKADLIAIDLNQPHLTPCYEPVSHLVYAASGSDVRLVWVAGQLVVANAQVQTIDVPRTIREVQRLADKIRR